MSYPSNTDLITVPQKALSAPSSDRQFLRPDSQISLSCSPGQSFPQEPPPCTQLSQLLIYLRPRCELWSALLCLLDCQLPEGRGVTYLQAWRRPLVNTCELVSPVVVPAHHRHLHSYKVQEEGKGAGPR